MPKEIVTTRGALILLKELFHDVSKTKPEEFFAHTACWRKLKAAVEKKFTATDGTVYDLEQQFLPTEGENQLDFAKRKGAFEAAIITFANGEAKFTCTTKVYNMLRTAVEDLKKSQDRKIKTDSDLGMDNLFNLLTAFGFDDFNPDAE